MTTSLTTVTSSVSAAGPERSRRGRFWWLLVSLAAGLSLLAQAPTEGDFAAPAAEAEVTPEPETGSSLLVSLDGDLLPDVFLKETPASGTDLFAIQDHLQALIKRVSSCVVAVRVGGSTGSGVVVSEDGIVLSAAHVCGEPGRNVTFTFSDGSTARGKTLGTFHSGDAGMMQITDKGSWHYADLGALEQVDRGDWAVAFGHPGGFELDRSIVVRLGRVIRILPGMMQTDCTIVGGDSGGPLFDMNGRVIGIHSRISESTTANFHVSIGTYHDGWDRLVKGDNWGAEEFGRRSVAYIGVGGSDHPDGCRLDWVDADSPAAKAGLEVGDVLLKINELTIKSYDSFWGEVKDADDGDKVKLTVRRGEKEWSVEVMLERRRR